MLRLYREKPSKTNPVNEISNIPVYFDYEGCMWLQTNIDKDRKDILSDTSVGFSKFMLTSYGAVIFYGPVVEEKDIELCDGTPPPRVIRYG